MQYYRADAFCGECCRRTNECVKIHDLTQAMCGQLKEADGLMPVDWTRVLPAVLMGPSVLVLLLLHGQSVVPEMGAVRTRMAMLPPAKLLHMPRRSPLPRKKGANKPHKARMGSRKQMPPNRARVVRQ